MDRASQQIFHRVATFGLHKTDDNRNEIADGFRAEAELFEVAIRSVPEGEGRFPTAELKV